MSGGDATRFGKYKILKHIAAGGMGEVHLAKLKGPVGFEKLVVIKRLLDHRQNEPKYIDMFFSEARVAAQLTHSNIAQVYEVGNYEGVHYIAMEYVQGKSLRKILDVLESKNQFLPHAYVAQIISELCAGLAFAHDARHLSGAPMDIIHRDINPQNVLVSYHGEVKVIDFGIAKSELSLEKTKAGTIKGTVVYMSPEQSHGKKLDRRSDIFSVGICLYEALTSINPFHKDTLAASLEVIREASYPPLDIEDPKLALFAPIVTRALARQADQRYQDAREMADDLRTLMGSGSLPRPPLPLSRYLASLFADDIAEEERLLSQTELAEMTPLGQTATIIVEESQSAFMSDEKTVADSSAREDVQDDRTGAYRRRTDDHDTGPRRGLGAPAPPSLTVKTVIPIPEPQAEPAAWSDLKQPRIKWALGGLAASLLIGGMLLLRHAPPAAPAPKPSGMPIAQASATPTEAAQPPSLPENKPPVDSGKAEAQRPSNSPPNPPSESPTNNTQAAANETKNDNDPPEVPRRMPSRRGYNPPLHRHPQRVRPQHVVEPPPEPPAPSPPALPTLQLFLEPSDLHVSLNGVTAGSSIKFRNNSGTLKIGTGEDPDTDPFVIIIYYRIEAKSITYSVESEPWANVAGVGGISLGRTPLQSVRGESTTVLEFRNPRVGGTPRVTLRFTAP